MLGQGVHGPISPPSRRVSNWSCKIFRPTDPQKHVGAWVWRHAPPLPTLHRDAVWGLGWPKLISHNRILNGIVGCNLFWVGIWNHPVIIFMFTPAFTNAGSQDIFCPVTCKRNGRFVFEIEVRLTCGHLKHTVNPRPAGVWLVTRYAGGGGEISQTTGPISKFKTPFNSPCTWTTRTRSKIWPGDHWWCHRSDQSQNFRLFGLGDIGE